MRTQRPGLIVLVVVLLGALAFYLFRSGPAVGEPRSPSGDAPDGATQLTGDESKANDLKAAAGATE